MGEQRWTVQVDAGVCIGSGMCASIAPRHFTLDGDRSRPVAERIAPEESVLDAADSCPMEAIRVFDETGTQLAPTE
ncbi:MAG TPA: ferredoxin [Pseudonocardiaceae bacterium]